MHLSRPRYAIVPSSSCYDPILVTTAQMDLDDSAGAMERFFFLHLLLHVLLALDCSTSIILLNPDNDAPLFVHLSNPFCNKKKTYIIITDRCKCNHAKAITNGLTMLSLHLLECSWTRARLHGG